MATHRASMSGVPFERAHVARASVPLDGVMSTNKLADHASVVVGAKVESGATVVIGRRSWYVSEELGRGVFHLDGKGELTYGTLAASAH
jgi:hypothetical protein